MSTAPSNRANIVRTPLPLQFEFSLMVRPHSICELR